MNNSSVFHGPLRVCRENPGYFTDETGKAIYLTGSHTWAVMQDMWPEGSPRKQMDYAEFLMMMVEYRHNFLRFWQWMHVKNAPWSSVSTIFDPQPFLRTGPETARDGLPKFDLSRWNEDYFTRLRQRVEMAAERGIYLSIMMFEAWCIKNGGGENDPWNNHPMHPDNNINGITDNPVLANGKAWDFYSLNCPQLLEWQKAFIRKIVDTVNNFDNVLYEICNEIPYRPEAMAWQQHLCSFIKEYEQNKPCQHPVGITAEGGIHDNAELFACNADWISPSNGRVFEYRYNPPASDGTKIVLNDTDHLWGHGGNIAWVWKSFTRGMNVLFMDPWEPIPGELDWWRDGDITRNQRYYYAWDPLRRNLGYTRMFAQRMNLNRCIPHNELCTSTYCLAHPGRKYLCFFPHGGVEGLDVWESTGEFGVEWFNPTTGVTTPGPHLTGGNRYTMEAPFDGPAVLYLYQS